MVANTQRPYHWVLILCAVLLCMMCRPAVLVNSAGGLAGFAAGLGQAFGAGSISRRSRAPSDSGGSADNAGGSGGGRRASEQ